MLDRNQAERELEDVEVVPCWEGSIDDGKELMSECLANDIPVMLMRPDTATPHRHGPPRVALVARPDDVSRIAELFRKRWHGMLAQEGFDVPVAHSPAPSADGDAPEGEPPCPACGTAAPLVNGACSECGLQLE